MDPDSDIISTPLPLEIVEYLAGFFWEDQATLKVYTLICRSWNQVAKPYLYRSITIYDEFRLHELENLLESNKSMQHWIRELRIEGGLRSARDSPFDSWVFVLAMKLPNLLKRLHTLEFVSVQPYPSGLATQQLEDFVSQMTGFLTLKCLSFIDCSFQGGVLLSFIHGPQHLEELHLHDIRMMSSTLVGQDSDHPPPSMRLRQLKIHSTQPDYAQPLPEFLKWFTSKECMSTLQSVEIDVRYISGLKDTGAFLKTLGPTLRYLNLRFTDSQHWGHDRGSREIIEHIDLGHNTELQSLKLHNPRHPAVLHLLSQVASPHLEKIVFDVTFTHVIRGLKTSDFEVLDQCLAQDNFQLLKEVWFMYSGMMNKDNTMQKMQTLMKGAYDRGILRLMKMSLTGSQCGVMTF
ncbi:hypothetical protein C8Q75DRAFT_762131 [Abortiporus biennis]|nr:hypothetical protein C8Q75DRAFT_762131 [Abortiporus biennis]